MTTENDIHQAASKAKRKLVEERLAGVVHEPEEVDVDVDVEKVEAADVGNAEEVLGMVKQNPPRDNSEPNESK